MITSKLIANGIIRAIIIIVASAIGIYFLYQIQSVLIYLVVSLILTLIGNPFLDFFKKRLKFSHNLATITTIVIFVAIIFGIIILFVPLITSQSQNLSLLNTREIEQNAIELINQINAFLESHHINAKKILNFNSITSKINFGIIPNFLNSILGTISSFGMGLASVLFITFFFLKDRVLFVVDRKSVV